MIVLTFPARPDSALPPLIPIDQAERTKLYEQAQVIFKREAPWATLAHSLVTDVTTKNVTGYVQSAFGVHNFADVDITE